MLRSTSLKNDSWKPVKLLARQSVESKLIDICLDSNSDKVFALSNDCLRIFSNHQLLDSVSLDGAKKIVILHCVSNYPAKLESLNLSAINTLRRKTKLDIGWSDHSAKSLVVYKAIQKWRASYVEMHIDLDGKGVEYKNGHCWLPKNAKELINFLA